MQQFSEAIKTVARAIQAHEGYVPAGQYPPNPLGSPSFRNKNPGNIIFGDLARAYGATTFWTHPRTGHDFAIFPTYQDGFDCLCQLLLNACTGKSQIYRPEMTIVEFFTKYSPVRENGVVVPNIAYATDVAARLGVPIDTQIMSLVTTEQQSSMGFYSQHTPGYDKIKLGTCTDTLWQSACFLVSFCNLGKEMEWFDYNPVSMNKLFIAEKLWANGCLIVAPNIAKHFGLSYVKATTDPGTICIAETNYYKNKGVPQHFFLYEKGMAVDPLASFPAWKKNVYPIISYRIFKRLAVPIPPVPVETPVIPPFDTLPEAPKMQETPQDEVLPQTGESIPRKEYKAPESLLSLFIADLIEWIKRVFKK